jgi:membrane protease YdiL (CAAX protease family)
MDRMLTLPRRDLNATLGILGIFATAIFLTWLPISGLSLPLPRHPVDRTAVTGVWQFLMTIVVPYVWASRRLGMSPADLGISRKNLGKSVLLGCALYSLALVAFLYGRHDPLIQDHPIRHLPTDRMLLLGGTMCVIAAGTDIATRGFILLSLARHTGVPFAVLMQNVFWMLGHTHEIQVLESALGRVGANALFLVLGLLGDSIALRTRNVLGLAIAHILLNIVMVTVIRHLL